MKIALSDIVRSMAQAAGMDEKFTDELIENFKNSPEGAKEFAGYMMTGNLPLEYKVCNLTAADILVWQVDHFKAYMDRDVTATKHNSQYMVLNAFDIMLKMEKNPDKYLKLFEHESGNDIVNK